VARKQLEFRFPQLGRIAEVSLINAAPGYLVFGAFEGAI
jgi:hypothetical protein